MRMPFVWGTQGPLLLDDTRFLLDLFAYVLHPSTIARRPFSDYDRVASLSAALSSLFGDTHLTATLQSTLSFLQVDETVFQQWREKARGQGARFKIRTPDPTYPESSYPTRVGAAMELQLVVVVVRVKSSVRVSHTRASKCVSLTPHRLACKLTPSLHILQGICPAASHAPRLWLAGS